MKQPGFIADAIVLVVKDVADADRMITLFTKQWGLVKAIAYGARRAKSRIGGCLQVFSGVNIYLAVQNNRPMTIKQCCVEYSFRDIYTDVERYSRASLIAEMASELWPEHEADSDVYELLLNGFRAINNRNPRLAALATGWQLLSMAGFKPEYRRCVACGGNLLANSAFSVQFGGLICEECRTDDLPNFNADSTKLMSLLLNISLKEKNDFVAMSGTIKILEDIFAEYLCYYLGKKMNSFCFIKALNESKE